MKNIAAKDSVGSGAICSCCARFIGPIGSCPYCDEAPVQNKMLSMLRRTSLILSLIGLVFLYLAARINTFSLTDIAEITPMMNYAVVRVHGTVEKPVYISRENGQVNYLSFPLRDDNGKIRVSAYGAVARTLIEKKMLPNKGDSVDVTGSLRINLNGNIKIYLRSAEQLVKKMDQ